ncbi:MAG TPA: hypothetical protein VFP50_03100 [Anaeromyxobacteraceae bacterium]|nr:hypothetical protein [Anaeromyxobacteraceae bacterium]
MRDHSCVSPGFAECQGGPWEFTTRALTRLQALAIGEGRAAQAPRVLRLRAMRALGHPCTAAALDEELMRSWGDVVSHAAMLAAEGVLTGLEALKAERARAPRAEARASSTLAAYGSITYEAKNVLDGSLETAWCEGKAGSGVDEWIEVSIDPAAPPLHHITVLPGYAKTTEAFRRNDRPIALRVAPCDAPDAGVVWDPRSSPDQEPPWDARPSPVRLSFEPRTRARCVRVTILAVVPSAEADACITEIVPVVSSGKPGSCPVAAGR